MYKNLESKEKKQQEIIVKVDGIAEDIKQIYQALEKMQVFLYIFSYFYKFLR